MTIIPNEHKESLDVFFHILEMSNNLNHLRREQFFVLLANLCKIELEKIPFHNPDSEGIRK